MQGLAYDEQLLLRGRGRRSAPPGTWAWLPMSKVMQGSGGVSIKLTHGAEWLRGIKGGGPGLKNMRPVPRAWGDKAHY